MNAHDAGGPAGPDVEQVMWQLAVDAAGIGADRPEVQYLPTDTRSAATGTGATR